MRDCDRGFQREARGKLNMEMMLWKWRFDKACFEEQIDAAVK